uniref:Uncharacterized protein n=1 Tax=Panagrolaimus sp. ES5 TaxID=591445 RepID=A0AC34G0W1_9BILA
MLNGNISEDESRTQDIFDGKNYDEASTSMSDKDRNQEDITDNDDLWDVSAGLQELETFLSPDFHDNNVNANLAFVAACICIKEEENELKMFSTKLKMNETQKEAIEFLQDLEKDEIYDIDYKSIQPPQSKSKSTLNYWDSFKQEHRWIGKEQRNLEKWQRKWARKV